jgi:glycine cleavage system H protein
MDPASVKYLESHEWFAVDQGVATVGVSDFAQQQLNDVVFVELPAVGRKVDQGDPVCVLESCKAAADVYSPVAGEIVEVNSALSSAPEKVNKSPFDEGWLFKVKVARHNANDPRYLDKAAYEQYCQSQG